MLFLYLVLFMRLFLAPEHFALAELERNFLHNVCIKWTLQIPCGKWNYMILFVFTHKKTNLTFIFHCMNFCMNYWKTSPKHGFQKILQQNTYLSIQFYRLFEVPLYTEDTAGIVVLVAGERMKRLVLASSVPVTYHIHHARELHLLFP